MSATEPSVVLPSPVSFADFTVDPQQRILFRGSKPVVVTPTAFKILMVLIANRHRAVSKEELVRTVWQDAIATDRALNQQIFLLRKALGEDSTRPRFIGTVSRFGFRFICPVHVETLPSLSSEIRTIAVLPLADLSPQSPSDYFSDGLTEALISTLGKLHSIRVLGRISTLHIRDNKRSARDLARELGVDGILEGAVRRDGQRLRVDLRLVEGASQFQKWAETYEREISDVLIVQREIAQAVATALGATMSETERVSLAAAPVVNREAHDACLRGYHHLNRMTHDELGRAAVWFKRAVEADPTYAAAHAGLAHWFVTAVFSAIVPRDEAILSATDAANRALACDPGSPEALAAVGRIALLELKLARAIAYLESAIRLDPTNEAYYRNLALALICHGRIDDAVRTGAKAVDADPLSPRAHVICAETRYVAGDYGAAMAAINEALTLEPSFGQAEYYRGLILLAQADLAGAFSALERARALVGEPPHPSLLAAIGYVHAREGRVEQARCILADLTKAHAARLATGLDLAVALLALEGPEQAIKVLEKSFEDRDATSAAFRVEPLLASLHGDPRFEALLSRIAILGAS